MALPQPAPPLPLSWTTPFEPVPLLSTWIVVMGPLFPAKLCGKAIVPPPSMVKRRVGVTAAVATVN